MRNKSARWDSTRRRDVILQLVRHESVRSQHELAERLRRRGIAVTQPTLSRDVRELGLAKTVSGYVASEPGALERPPAEAREAALARALRNLALSLHPAGTLVIVRTPPAAAPALARALDEASADEIAGTIAGDDTVFVATPSERAARKLWQRLSAQLGEGERKQPA
jgi:transcriptional regulator of arginine metabolism